MEKYAVREEEDLKKKAADEQEEVKCPDCGMTTEEHGNVSKCPKCGTEPFEKKDD